MVHKPTNITGGAPPCKISHSSAHGTLGLSVSAIASCVKLRAAALLWRAELSDSSCEEKVSFLFGSENDVPMGKPKEHGDFMVIFHGDLMGYTIW